MSKAKEYYDDNLFMAKVMTKGIAKTMNHKTIEDVKEEAMLKSKYLEFRGVSVVIYMEDLEKILEKLKL